MSFASFILLNAILLIRPEELYPEIEGVRFYLIAIAICTFVNLPRLVELLSFDSLRSRPLSVCILLIFASTIVSLLVLGRINDALFDFGPEFAKVILYYFLLIASVDTAERFRAFVIAILILIVILCGIAVAQQLKLVNFPNIQPAMQRVVDPLTGEESFIERMTSSGILGDPNDLCLILGLGMLCCVYGASTTPAGVAMRVLWLSPIPLFIYALLETHSRGGMLGVLAGASAYLYSRFGGPKALPFAIAGCVAALAIVGGRQGNITGGDTAHERLMMWADGLTNLFYHPLLIPTGLGNDWFIENCTLLAHNSFIQAYVELGLFGGGAFLGAFLIGARMLDRIGRGIEAPAWVVEARHFGFAALSGYAMGCYSLTRNFVLPTYLTLGIAAVLLEQGEVILPEAYCVSKKWFARGVILSICGLIFLKYATQGLGVAGI
jgi:hypothetical protein